MMNSKVGLVIPVAMIIIGLGALLTALKIAPQIDWVWTLSIAVAGLAFPLGLGFDKITFVACAVLLAISVLSILRQTVMISLSIEIPTLVIWLGIVLLISRLKIIPNPTWFDQSQENK